MKFDNLIQQFLIRRSYTKKLVIIVSVGLSVGVLMLFAGMYYYDGLLKSSINQKTTLPLQDKVNDIINLVSGYQLEVQNKQINPELFSEMSFRQYEKEIESQVQQFKSIITQIDYKARFGFTPQKLLVHTSQFEQFSKYWSDYKKKANGTNVKESFDDYIYLSNMLNELQKGLRVQDGLIFTIDEGTKRLIDAAYVLLPQLTQQVPLYYSLMSDSTEFDIIPLEKKSDLFGGNLLLQKIQSEVQRIFVKIPEEVNSSLNFDVNDLFSPMLSSFEAVNNQMIELSHAKITSDNSAVPTDSKAVFELAKGALGTYQDLQKEIHSILMTLIQKQTAAINFKFYWILFSVTGAMFMAALLYFTRIIRKPIEELTLAASQLAVGKIAARVVIHSNDEVGEMGKSFNALADFLQTNLNEIKVVATDLLKSAQFVYDKVKKMEGNIEKQEMELGGIKGYTKEIDFLLRDFSLKLSEVYKSIQLTTSFAEVGKNNTAEMELVMNKMVGASKDIVMTLQTLLGKVGLINDVIGTVVQVADKINLLSINTAIQARKAGDNGRGFTVIAKKIKELSGQTALATLEIEEIIEQIIEAVNSSAIGVNEFSSQVLNQVNDSKMLGDELIRLMHFYQNQVEIFQGVHEDMKKQSKSAHGINEMLLDLGNASEKTSLSIQQLYKEIHVLYQSISYLLETIDSFTDPEERSLKAIASGFVLEAALAGKEKDENE